MERSTRPARAKRPATLGPDPAEADAARRPRGEGPAEARAAQGVVRVILHGSRIDRDDVREAVERLRSEGHHVDVRVTWEAGDAARFAREAADTARIVVAVGGDGTVSEVAAGLAGRGGAALGVVPLGTANDFAASAGLPLDDVDLALDLAVSECAPVAVDLIRCNGKPFLNLATGGPGTRITAETPQGLKRALGGLSYAVAGAVAGATKPGAFEAQRGTVRGPDFEWSGAFLALVVGNGRQAGGGVVLLPDARIDDGLLDLRLVPDGSGAGALLLESLLRGREAVLDEASRVYRAPWVEVETYEPLHVNLDGEPVEGTRFRFEVDPGALNIVLPAGCPLLGGRRA